jgi:hypothetical protein
VLHVSGTNDPAISCPRNCKFPNESMQRRLSMDVPLIILLSVTNSLANTNTAHEIHKEQPKLVIDATREVVEIVRSGRRQLAR